ncbi:MAG: hypothetical protein JWN00_1696 [Actinomycetia bacterium]|jgi:hypothetical protein|nr:hypothetical protein [Actinomycetes bacterium]
MLDGDRLADIAVLRSSPEPFGARASGGGLAIGRCGMTMLSVIGRGLEA